MLNTIINYFTNLNNVGQALFIIGVLLVITFIILLVVVLKPENKEKKVYASNELTDSEEDFEKKMKDIDNIDEKDINIDNDKTRNLKSIVDELKNVEAKQAPSMEEVIQSYEDEQEDTAIISVEELLKSNEPFTYAKKEHVEYTNNEPVKEVKSEYLEINDKPIINKTEIKESPKIVTEETIKKLEDTSSIPIPKSINTGKREVFSSVFVPSDEKKEQDDNKEFLNSLKDFRNNL